MFLTFNPINWPNLIVWLPLLIEVLGNICIVSICFPVCGVIDFEINLAFLSSHFPRWPKKSGQKFKYLRTKRALKMYKGLSLKQRIWESDFKRKIISLASIHLFKVNHENIIKMYEISSKLTIKATQRD